MLSAAVPASISAAVPASISAAVPASIHAAVPAVPAVDIHDDVLQYIKNQTDEICLAAINQDIRALQYIKNQTDQLITIL